MSKHQCGRYRTHFISNKQHCLTSTLKYEKLNTMLSLLKQNSSVIEVYLKHTCICLLCCPLYSLSNPRGYGIAVNKLLKDNSVYAEHLKWSYSPYRLALF